MEAKKKVTMSVVEAPRPVEFDETMNKNARYVRVAVRNNLKKRDLRDPNEKGPVYGVIEAENPFLPIVDVALLRNRSKKELEAAEDVTKKSDKDPATLIRKLKLVMRLSLEGRHGLIENIRIQRQNSGLSEAELKAKAKQKVEITGMKISADAYTMALLELYMKVIQPAARAVIDAFQIVDDGQPAELRQQSLRKAKRTFFDAFQEAVLDDSAMRSLLSDYDSVLKNRQAKAQGGQK